MKKGKERKDCVYYYYFQETNSIYVGRTVDKKGTHYRHRNKMKKDTVAKYAYENGFEVPEMVILEDNLTVEQGQKQEGFWVNFYVEHGYNILNIAPTGSIGNLNGNTPTKWGYKDCYNVAKECNTMGEFQRKYSSAYASAKRYNWDKDYTWFIPTKELKTKWYETNIIEESKKYNKITSFHKNSPGAYQAAKKQGLIDKITYNYMQKKTICQYTSDGQLIAEYPSIREASRETNIDRAIITRCCKGKEHHKTAGGFIWRLKGDTFDKYETLQEDNRTIIHQYTKDGQFIKEYISMSDAAKDNNIKASHICYCCKNKRGYKTAGGFIWKYA